MEAYFKDHLDGGQKSQHACNKKERRIKPLTKSPNLWPKLIMVGGVVAMSKGWSERENKERVVRRARR